MVGRRLGSDASAQEQRPVTLTVIDEANMGDTNFLSTENSPTHKSSSIRLKSGKNFR
ncbi:hypothetical protein SBG_2200 [Salmonella bongori NCTC 12419]|uniref:Uncharacterized protein n=1 Tax=Salmonella bongori (strain ATCC 43975 / DSM 13772 / NCTC 12419) TaxID=218493 RepID=A0A0K0HCK7_SALBC|nr:hypothetical protein SBG_2200 [Salmonella bongori NCTC 12419]